MPILPIIDLLILLAWTTLAAGGALKLVNVALARYWTLLGFAPFDLLMISAVLLVFALTLVGRTWVKANDPALLAAQRADATREAYAELVAENGRGEPAQQSTPTWQNRQLGG